LTSPTDPNPAAGTAAPSQDCASEEALYRRVALRVVPLLFAAYVAAYLNRVNVGFARLEMVSDLKFSDTVYGLGSGMFFIGYLLLEVPSNILLHRIGARVWIARIMITWSLLSAATMLARSPAQFYLARFALGAAEAGFFPGMILYLTYWFPAKGRARVMATLVTAIAASGFLGGPLSGWILRDMDGVRGLAGWKWLFIVEALPSLLLGFAILAWLPDSIRGARWLEAEQKDFLEKAIHEEGASKAPLPLRALFVDPRVWGLSLIYFLIMVGLAGLSFWMPQIIRNAGVRGMMGVGLLSAVPYVVAAAATVALGRHSDRTGERFWHLVLCVGVATAGFVLIAVSGSNAAAALAGLSLAASGIIGSLPLFWTYPAAFLGGVAAAAGIALINSVGNMGGFACPYIVGALNDATHSQVPGLAFIAASLAAAAVLVAVLLRKGRTHGGVDPAVGSPGVGQRDAS